MKPKTFSIISLGCPKNTVDSEVLKGYLESYRMNFEPEPENADVVIINTCGFIESSREESVGTILETLELKKTDPGKKVIVTGCLSQRYPEQLRIELPEVDGIFGVDATDSIVKSILNTSESCDDVERIRSLLTPGYSAYLKIAEGCDNQCSFCSIPLIRGKQRSRSIDSLIREASYLKEKGVRELVLIAQDLTRYGSDLGPKTDLYTLLDELLSAKLFPWVRLLYTNPDFWDGKINRLFRKYPELCPYLDIPIQHASPRILKLMERGNDIERIKHKLLQLRKDVPEVALRTSVMVGFPSESLEDFYALMDFIEEVRFERLGVFTYSQEENTQAAELPDNVSPDEKEMRRDVIMQLQWTIALEFAESKIGQKITVLIESEAGDDYFGRSVWDAPEIDGFVRVHSEEALEIGEFYTVKISRVEGIDLVGKII
ncbi:30S ribosomal protein S12 methylthiotransferase RimO [bacterium]|nr:30S ribosomal protein S12 methylthiotransferase RimO [bacterium]MBU1872824.1 30S ribosomal protein S12 methylthiotransferase RimO [bacterium]